MESVDYIIPVCSVGGQDAIERISNLQYVIEEFLSRQTGVTINLIIVEQICTPFRPLSEQIILPGNATVIIVKSSPFNKGWLQNIGAAASDSPHMIMADLDCCYENNEGIHELMKLVEKQKLKWCIGWNKIYYAGQRCKKSMIEDGKMLTDDLQDIPQEKLQAHEGGIVYFNRRFWENQLGGSSEFFLDLRGMDNSIAFRSKILSGQYRRHFNTLIHLYHPWSPMKSSPHRSQNKKILEFTRKYPEIVTSVNLKMQKEGLLGNKEYPASKKTSFYFQRTNL